MQEEVTQKTVTFCVRTTKMTADVLKKVIAAYLRHQKQKSAETGENHGEGAGKAECRDDEY